MPISLELVIVLLGLLELRILRKKLRGGWQLAVLGSFSVVASRKFAGPRPENRDHARLLRRESGPLE